MQCKFRTISPLLAHTKCSAHPYVDCQGRPEWLACGQIDNHSKPTCRTGGSHQGLLRTGKCLFRRGSLPPRIPMIGCNLVRNVTERRIRTVSFIYLD